MRWLDPNFARARMRSWSLLGLALLLTVVIYWPGLSGGWLFDDYPNIVDNRGVQPPDARLSSLARAALSSPSSEFKRPLASLSFAANYLATGLDPYWMKLTNLLIHLLNGLLVFLLSRRLLAAMPARSVAVTWPTSDMAAHPDLLEGRNGVLAALIAASWLVLPINLTGVLYVVQRMESMANVFVLLGLVGYVTGRQRMLAGRRGFVECVLSVTVPTAIGLLAKETAVMLPLYAFFIEWLVFGFRRTATTTRDWRLLLLFAVVLILPMLIGLAWIVPYTLSPDAFSTRNFTLKQRLLSEARIVTDYISWSLLPTPNALSFYHDDFHTSTSLVHPWTTLASLLTLAIMIGAIVRMQRTRPLVALGLALYLSCHLLTATILPLELIYEHRNYFASFGLLLAVIPLLAAPGETTREDMPSTTLPSYIHRPLPMSLPRYVALGGLMLFWSVTTGLTAHLWGDPLRLAIGLADRAPESPRAQYELGRMYIIYSQYDPSSPFIRLAYEPLERAAAIPSSSILPQQALIFMNARLGRPLKDAWWDSMIAKLKARRPGVQDESSLGALTQCAREGLCQLPPQRMVSAFLAALSHPNPSARLLATYGDYAWNLLGDHQLGLRLSEEAMATQPAEPAYRITCIRMLVALGRVSDAMREYEQLDRMNIGGNLDGELRSLHETIGGLANHSGFGSPGS